MDNLINMYEHAIYGHKFERVLLQLMQLKSDDFAEYKSVIDHLERRVTHHLQGRV